MTPTTEGRISLPPALLATGALGVVAWVLITRAGTVLAGHPAYLVLLVLLAGIGIPLFVVAARRRRWHLAVRIVGGLLTVLLIAATAWLRPFAVDARATVNAAVTVTSSPTAITLTPADPAGTVGVIVQPGARVDPRAYVPLWSQIAAQGYLVVIVKQPLNIGFLAIGAPTGIQEQHPQISTWALSGHSLGGAAASQFAADNPQRADGIVFWASYPLDSLADRDDLVVASIAGSADTLATPEDIEASRVDLPEGATVTMIDGAVHAFFGDYGEQPGDGTPTISREQAQDAIITATLDALAEIG